MNAAERPVKELRVVFHAVDIGLSACGIATDTLLDDDEAPLAQLSMDCSPQLPPKARRLLALADAKAKVGDADDDDDAVLNVGDEEAFLAICDDEKLGRDEALVDDDVVEGEHLAKKICIDKAVAVLAGDSKKHAESLLAEY